MALIDKGSVVVAMQLAGLVLREVITLRMIAGAGLIVAGLLVILDSACYYILQGRQVTTLQRRWKMESREPR